MGFDPLYPKVKEMWHPSWLNLEFINCASCLIYTCHKLFDHFIFRSTPLSLRVSGVMEAYDVIHCIIKAMSNNSVQTRRKKVQRKCEYQTDRFAMCHCAEESNVSFFNHELYLTCKNYLTENICFDNMVSESITPELDF